MPAQEKKKIRSSAYVTIGPLTLCIDECNEHIAILHNWGLAAVIMVALGIWYLYGN